MGKSYIKFEVSIFLKITFYAAVFSDFYMALNELKDT